MHRLIRLSSAVVVGVAVVSMTATSASAQEPKSATGAKELAGLLAGKKMDAVAVRAPQSADTFLAALSFPGQLIVISAKYAAPPLLNEKLARREYRDVYIELNSASVLETRQIITDLGADGLRPKRAKKDDPFDSRELAGKAFNLDGNWREDKMSEADYMKLHADTDAQYAEILTALLGEAKK